MKFYVGCYTTRLDGQGLTTVELSGNTLKIVDVSKTLIDPLYAVLNKNKTCLFVGGVDDQKRAICAKFDVRGEKPVLMETGLLGAPDFCHIELSPDEKYAYSACYGSGRVAVNKIQNQVKEAVQTIQLVGGSNVNPTRQSAAHAHQVTIVPWDDKLVNVVDLGSDLILTYNRDIDTGFLTELSRTETAPGSGPRHLVYAEDSRHAFLTYELGNLISVLEWTGKKWNIVQTLSTLPENYDQETYCGAIRYDEKTKRVLVTNRGHNSIAIFHVNEDFSLVMDSIIPCGGDFPRDLWVLDDGRMLTANQLSGTLALIDQNGTLLSEVKINAAVSVCG